MGSSSNDSVNEEAIDASSCSGGLDSSLNVRDYQSEIFEAAKHENLIVVLGTGTGKTYVAIMLIDHMAEAIRPSWKHANGKRTFFIVNTVALIEQQARAIEQLTNLKVCRISGELNVDDWDEIRWSAVLEDSHVFVMSAQIFYDILTRGYWTIGSTNLLILDECHHVEGERHPFRMIVRRVQETPTDERPRLLGLSASVILSNIKKSSTSAFLDSKLQERLSKLEYITNAKVVTSAAPDVELYANKSEILWECYAEAKDEDYSREFEEFGSVLRSLGPVGFWTVILNKEAEWNNVILSLDSDDKEILRSALVKLQNSREAFGSTCSCLPLKEAILQYSSCKLRQLFALLQRIARITSSDNNQTGIIFVKERINAFAIKTLIQTLAVQDPENFGHFKADFVVGQAGGRGSVCSSKVVDEDLDFADDVVQSPVSVANQMKMALKDFREGKINLLVATNVLEEGVDVAQCNFVIRYDFPETFTAFLQSRGRARKKNSQYYLLVASEEESCRKAVVEEYLETERLLIKIAIERTREFIGNNDNLAGFIDVLPEDGLIPSLRSPTSGIVLRPCDAVRTIYNGVSTTLSPDWKYSEEDPVNKLFSVKLTLPINSLVKEEIEGRALPSKRLTQMDAAMNACKKLHEKGELTDKFLTKTKLDVEQDDDFDVEALSRDVDAALPNSKFDDYFSKKLAAVLQSGFPEQRRKCYLYEIHLTLKQAKEFQIPDLLNPEKSIVRLGILTKNELPQVPGFPLYTRIGEIAVSLKPLKTFLGGFNQSQLDIWIKFNDFVLCNILRVATPRCNLIMAGRRGAIIVPLTHALNLDPSVAMKMPMELPKLLPFPANDDWLEKLNRREVTPCAANEYLHKVISPAYPQADNGAQERNSVRRRFYFVTKILSETPLSGFKKGKEERSDDSTFQTYADYFRKKYALNVADSSQNLLEAVEFEPWSWAKLELNLLHPVQSKKDHKIRPYDEYLMPRDFRTNDAMKSVVFIPEFCNIIAVSPDVWNVMFCLPRVFYRVNQFLLADELRVEVLQTVMNQGDECRLLSSQRWQPLGCRTHEVNEFMRTVYEAHGCERFADDVEMTDAGDSDASDESRSFDECMLPEHLLHVDFEAKRGPNPCLIVEALTTKSAGDCFDLERLETLGDSFLKFAVSVFLTFERQDKNEGTLTTLRMKRICNKTLRLVALKKNLAGLIFSSKFDCSSSLTANNWLPWSFHQSEVEANLQSHHRSPLLIEDMEDSEDSYDEEDFMDCADQESCEKPKIPSKAEQPQRQHDLRFEQLVRKKTVADCVEALIGAYLITFGSQGAKRFITYLGIDVTPTKSIEQPLLRFVAQPELQLENLWHLKNFGQFEKDIKYHFKDKAYLIEAFTHPSFKENRVTKCYQRLEFLGDAALDYLITRVLFKNKKRYNPGELTSLRSALVNNVTFATHVVRHGWHAYLLHQCSDMLRSIHQFQRILEDGVDLNDVHALLLKPGCCGDEPEELDVPKALGDVFESVAGAIYLDSGCSLDCLWSIYSPIIRDCISACCANPIAAMNPELRFNETVAKWKNPRKAIWTIAGPLKSGKFRATAKFKNEAQEECQFLAVGRTKKVARRTAAKLALRSFTK